MKITKSEKWVFHILGGDILAMDLKIDDGKSLVSRPGKNIILDIEKSYTCSRGETTSSDISMHLRPSDAVEIANQILQYVKENFKDEN